jgi:hypothetical protein
VIRLCHWVALAWQTRQRSAAKATSAAQNVESQKNLDTANMNL